MSYTKTCTCLLCGEEATIKAEYPLGISSAPGGWVTVRTYLLNQSESHTVCTSCSAKEKTAREAAAKKHYKSFYQRIFG